jgi:hypothetical protein
LRVVSALVLTGNIALFDDHPSEGDYASFEFFVG